MRAHWNESKQIRSNQINALKLTQLWMKTLEQLHETVYPRSLRHTTPHHHQHHHHAIRCYIALYHPTSYHTISHHNVLHHNILCHTTPYLTTPHYAMPLNALPCYDALHRIDAQRIESNHTLFQRIVSYLSWTSHTIFQQHTPYFTTHHTMPMPPHSIPHITVRSYYTLPQHLNTTHRSIPHHNTHIYVF